MSKTETRHDLFVYGTDATFTTQLVRYLVAGIDADEHVAVVVSPSKQLLLRYALGSAAEQVTFADPAVIYSRPEATMATLDAAVRGSAAGREAGIRMYGELPLCRTRAEWDAWMTYEAVVDHVFAERAAVLMCGYDTRIVPDHVIRQAWQTHRVVLSDVWQLSRDYERPENVVRTLAPPLADLDLRSLIVGPGLQERIAAELVAAVVPPRRARDAAVAIREVLANAERHGLGVRAVRVGRVGEHVVCEVTDRGPGLDDPLAGYVPPVPLAASGAGLWIARQLTARLELQSGDGLTVRLWI